MKYFLRLSLIIFIFKVPLLSWALSAPVYMERLPNMHVNSFAQDKHGFMWIATANGLCRSDGRGYKVFYFKEKDKSTISSNFVGKVLVDSQGYLWATAGNGVSLLNNDNITFQRFIISSAPTRGYCCGIIEFNGKIYAYGYQGLYKVNKSKRYLEQVLYMHNQVVWDALVDRNKNIWMITDKTILEFDASMHLLSNFSVSSDNMLNCITVIGDKILIGTKKGVLSINYKSLRLNDELNKGILKQSDVRTITLIGKNRLLLGTANRGVIFYDIVSKVIENKDENSIFKGLNSPEITSSFVDKDNNIWIGTFANGCYHNSAKKEIINEDKKLLDFFKNKFVTRIIGDKNGNMWIGTRYNGLFSYNIKTHVFKNYTSLTHNQLQLFNNDFIHDLFIDRIGRLWIGYGDTDMLLVCNVGNGLSINVAKKFSNIGDVVTMAQDYNHNIWVGTSNKGAFILDENLNIKSRITASLKANSSNITKIIYYSPTTMLFSAYMDNIYLVDINTLRESLLNAKYQYQWRYAVDLLLDGRNNLLIGTYENGLFQYNLKTYINCDVLSDKGLSTHDMVAIMNDNRNNIWVGSSYGLYRLNINNGMINNINIDGNSQNQYNEKAVYKDGCGHIFFGSNNGIEEILPENIALRSKEIPVYLTDLKLFNNSIIPGDNTGILKQDVSKTHQVRLKYNQNFISIDFAGLDYENPGQLNYSYRLKGYENAWNYIGQFNRANYSNLPHGEYVFEVRVQSGDGQWSNPYELLTITVKTAPWLHPVAIFAYVIMLLLLLYYGIKVYIRLKLNKERYAMAVTQMEHEKSLSQMKVDFFTNISHELRTPLSLIYGPVKQLSKYCDDTHDDKIAKGVYFIEKNVERLLSLLNQLLDFERIKNDTLPLLVSKHDCVQQLQNVVSIYKIYAEEKKLNLSFECVYDKLVVTYDSDKLDKIMNNLLFNAAKYTQEGGDIKVEMELTKSVHDVEETFGWTYMRVSVSDTGIGIAKNKISEVYIRFKRIINSVDGQKITGTGVGLNYVKHLIENHKGFIEALRNKDRGMTFTFWIPVNDSAYCDDEKMTDNNMTNSESDVEIEPEIDLQTKGFEKNDGKKDEFRYTVLLVEDSKDMNVFLSDMFVGQFNVLSALDGQEGLHLANLYTPDIIISDVLMPRMDGFEMCRRIKNDKEICHIPVILLTAKTMSEDQVEGYNQGADIYVTKPFNPEVLISMVNSLIVKIERQKNMIASGTGEEDERQKLIANELNPLDQKFVNKLYSYIDKHLTEEEMNVTVLGSELGFSRTNFYRKIKALTGMSPNDFLQVYRLNKAAQLIKKQEYQLNEISEMVGFGTQSYFSQSFKKRFGVSPKDYISKYKSNK